MACFFSPKIKSSTILETLVALIIILIAISFSLVIFTHVTQSRSGMSKLNAHVSIANFFEVTEQKMSYFDEDIFFQQLKLVKRIEKHTIQGNAHILTITAFDINGNKIADHKKIIVLYEAN